MKIFLMKSESFLCVLGKTSFPMSTRGGRIREGLAGNARERNPTVLNCLLLCGREQLLSRLGWGVAALKTLKEIRDRSTLAA